MDKGFQPMKYRVLQRTIRSPSPKGARKSNFSCGGGGGGGSLQSKIFPSNKKIRLLLFLEK